MASPQVEDGFTQIAHELLEAIARAPLRGAQLRVLLVVIRRTYGAFGNPKSAALSLGEIARATGLGKARASRVVGELLRARVLVEDVDSDRLMSAARRIGPNKDYELWSLPVAPVTPVARAQPVAPVTPVAPCGYDPVPTRATPDRSKPAPRAASRAPRDLFETTSPKGEGARTARARSTKANARVAESPATMFKSTFFAAFRARHGADPIVTNHAKLGALVKGALRALEVAGSTDALADLSALVGPYLDLAGRDAFYAGAPIEMLLEGRTLARLRAARGASSTGDAADPSEPALWHRPDVDREWERAVRAGGAAVNP